MTYFFHVGGGGLPENHPAYTFRHNLDNVAFAAALNGGLLHVIAPRQVGKTSLLKRLRSRLLAERWRCVVIDLSTKMNLSMLAWYSELGNKLAKELTPGFQPAVTNHLSLSAYLTGEALQEIYGPLHIAVLFDEVEGVIKLRDEQGQPFSDAFFMTIRDLYQKRDTFKGLLVIGLAGAVSTANLVKETAISPFNVGLPLDIDDFTWEEAKIFTSHLSDSNVPVDDSVHETIYSWTSGHPYLTHRICSELEQMVYAGQLTRITNDNVTSVVKRIFLQPKNPLLTDSNIIHAAKMLKHLPAPALPLWERLHQGATIPLGSVDTETFTDLYLTGVIKSQDEQLVIRNRIYEEAFTMKTGSELGPGQAPPAFYSSIGADNEPLLSYELPPSITLPKAGEQFLEGAELDRIIALIHYAIDGKSEYVLQNMLAACHIPSGMIGHIKYHEGAWSVANELTSRLVRGGALAPQYQSHAFGAFLAYLAEHELVGFDAALEMIVLIFKYHLILDRAKVRELSRRFQIPLPSFADPSYPNGQITLSPLPDPVRALLVPPIRERLESLYNRGIRHYVAPQFFINGYKAINAVCRIEFDKRGIATGFLIAPALVLTNYHVFKPEGTFYDLSSRANSCQVRFAAKRDDDGSEEPGRIFKLHKDWLVASSEGYELDYLLLRLERSATDGVIAPVKIISDADAIHKDMFVNIIHHPLGGAMEVSLRCNEVVEVEPQRIYYLADTEEGSSGAPVFDDNWRVVALHRSGGEKDTSGRFLKKANAGIPIGLIMKKIEQYLPHGF